MNDKTDASSIKYIVPNINTLNLDLNNIVSNQSILTDNFCVVGADSAYNYDDNNNPLIGTSPPLAYTYDGITYFPSSNNTLYYISKVDFNGYQWIATGQNLTQTQSIQISSNGKNWISPILNVLPAYISDVAWGNKRWVACGQVDTDNNINRIAYSSDGIIWNLSPYNSDDSVTNIFNCVAYNGSYFLVGGENVIVKSTNGIDNWSSTDVTSTLGVVTSITWNGNRWVATGNNANSIAYSDNGTLWFPSQSAQNLMQGGGYIVVYNGTIFLAGGSGTFKLISSVDGINWTGVLLDNNPYLPGTITDITWNGTIWIVTNSTNDLADPMIAYSLDLISWNSSISGNELFIDTHTVNSITSRDKKNYINTYL